MKKLGIFLVFLIGFIIVFLISGYISYQKFDHSDNSLEEPESNIIMVDTSDSEMPAVVNTGELTIVTPALNEKDTIVRYGTKDDIVEKAEKSVDEGLFSTPDSEVKEIKDSEKTETKDLEKTVTKPEVKKEQTETKPTEKKETALNSQKQESTVKTEVKEEAKTEEKAATKDLEKTEEKAEPEAEVKSEAKVESDNAKAEKTNSERAEEVVKEPEINLNPNVQISDSGL